MKKEKGIIDVQLGQFFESLSIALEEKDKYTRGHSQRVEEYCNMISKELDLNNDEIEIVSLSARLHDIGKIGIPENILNKPEKLTKEEFEIIKTHPELGARILEPLKHIDKRLINMVKYHHERYDGKGYFGKTEIPLICHILIISDSIDAMLSNRSYRSQNSLTYALEEVNRCKGTQFHPDTIDAFLRVVEKGCCLLKE